MARSLIFVHWDLEELVEVAQAAADVSIECICFFEQEAAYEMDIEGSEADLAAFHIAYSALFSED